MKHIRMFLARVRLYLYFRERYCYICMQDGNTVCGVEELKIEECTTWPCKKHLDQASREMKEDSGQGERLVHGVSFCKYW